MEIPNSILTATIRSTFQLEFSHFDADGRGETFLGTAFAFACLTRPLRPVLATAAHVLNCPPGNRVKMRLSRVNYENVLDCLVTIECPASGPECQFGSNKIGDLAYIFLPSIGDSGSPIFKDGEAPPRVIEQNKRLTAGTWLTWAGFPECVSSELESPHLCFFQGTVATFGTRPDCAPYAYYYVDGHAESGVSGGPVWALDEGIPSIAGIVSSKFKHGSRHFDLCKVEPINPLLAFARTGFRGIER